MISVKVITYQRPHALLALLDSLKNQQPLDAPLHFSVEVIDNAPSPLDSAIVERIQNVYGATYFHLGAKNISTARNTALARCTTPFLAFIDDDEIATTHWLAHLKQTLDRFKADVAFGPNVPILDHPQEKWIAACPFFNPPNPKTGTTTEFVESTANCLLRFDAIAAANLTFDERFGECGGGDSEFFARLKCLNFKFIWCREAITKETFEARRLSVRWLARRAFRCGGGRAAVLSRWDRSSYSFKGAYLLRVLPGELFNFAPRFRRRDQAPAEFGRAFWSFLTVLGFLFFLITGRVLTEYREGIRFTKFTHHRRLRELFWTFVREVALSRAHAAAWKDKRKRKLVWPPPRQPLLQS